ncbi:hypothetical protein CgunFtcFv8_018294 [Champsocephalus gunnari]|uniref:Uncharacterized protein n=1 Tax=Champsocephalus gunnari TaxID=52237 RepID=A0AAN8BSV8_CHAGU|nr:hypothetical protein CgunFtcFv8_018294 [Champsocephalus gunnari]
MQRSPPIGRVNLICPVLEKDLQYSPRPAEEEEEEEEVVVVEEELQEEEVVVPEEEEEVVGGQQTLHVCCTVRVREAEGAHGQQPLLRENKRRGEERRGGGEDWDRNET